MRKYINLCGKLHSSINCGINRIKIGGNKKEVIPFKTSCVENYILFAEVVV